MSRNYLVQLFLSEPDGPLVTLTLWTVLVIFSKNM